MAELGVLAYPVLMAAMCGLLLLGRGQRWGSFEWLRLAAFAIGLGLVVAVQAAFALGGYVQGPLTAGAALVSVAGTAGLVGLYLWQRWQQRPLPAAPPAGFAPADAFPPADTDA